MRLLILVHFSSQKIALELARVEREIQAKEIERIRKREEDRKRLEAELLIITTSTALTTTSTAAAAAATTIATSESSSLDSAEGSVR